MIERSCLFKIEALWKENDLALEVKHAIILPEVEGSGSCHTEMLSWLVGKSMVILFDVLSINLTLYHTARPRSV